jgi:nucleoside phosphorylase
MARPPRREEYTVGWVCALPIELTAARSMLDEMYGRIIPEKEGEDIYHLGSIEGHNVVIACLPWRTGTNSAAALATRMQAKFEGIRFGLMVGIGGGVPGQQGDIRLGDVVVSVPRQAFGGVVQYDMGKITPTEIIRTGSLDSPPHILLSAATTLASDASMGESKLLKILSQIDHIPGLRRGESSIDVLYDASYNHQGGTTCAGCHPDKQVKRSQRRRGEEVVVHYGTIASGNQVIKSAADRDKISQKLGGVLCFEMEAAGLMNSFPCLVIRGISDYADSHKNDDWHGFAAATAAAYAKELLSSIPPARVIEATRAEDVMRDTKS